MLSKETTLRILEEFIEMRRLVREQAHTVLSRGIDMAEKKRIMDTLQDTIYTSEELMLRLMEADSETIELAREAHKKFRTI